MPDRLRLAFFVNFLPCQPSEMPLFGKSSPVLIMSQIRTIMSQFEIEAADGSCDYVPMMNRESLNMNVMKQINKKYCILGVAALAAGLAPQAQATISYQISNAGLESANVSFDGTAYNGVLAGGIGITSTGGSGGPSSYVSLCTDFLGSLYLGNTYTYNAPVSITTPGLTGIAPAWGADNAGKTGSAIDTTSATLGLDYAAELFNNYGSVLTTGTTDQKAALQLAVWTALYDTTSSGVINAIGSRFDMNVLSSAGMTALGMLNQLVSPLSSSYVAPSVSLLVPNPISGGINTNPDGAPPQELFVATPNPQALAPTPVPEASTVVTGTLLLLSFGLCSLKSFGRSRS